MTTEDLKTRLQAELPAMLKQDVGFRQWLEQLIRETAVTPESQDRDFTDGPQRRAGCGRKAGHRNIHLCLRYNRIMS